MRPTQSKRARRVLVWIVVSFACAHLAFVLALARWPSLGDPEYGYKLSRLRRQLDAAPGRPPVVLLGTSRTALDFRPDALPTCRTANGQEPLVFNLALRGANPLLNLCCLQRLLDEGIHPEWLLIEILPPQLEGKGLEEGGVLYLKNRLRWGDLRELENQARAPWYQRARAYGPLLLPWAEYRRFILGQFAPSWVDAEWLRREGMFWRGQDASGWVTLPPTLASPEHGRAHSEYIRKNYGAPFTWTRIPPSTDRILRTMLERCAQARIKAALVIMPETSEFRSWYQPATAQVIDDYLARLSCEHDVPLIDTRTWMSDDCFADCHHLLPHGAAAFTERFGREALQPLLLGQFSRDSAFHARWFQASAQR